MPPVVYMQYERKKEPVFLPKTAEDDYGHALNYLGLIFPDDVAKAIVALLRKAPVQQLRVNDILRATRKGPAPKDDPNVDAEVANIKGEVPMSPVLLVQGDGARGIEFEIADGYHRCSAAYYRDPQTMMPCQIAKPKWASLDRPHA